MEQKERFMPVHIIAAAGIVKNDKNEILMVKTHGDNWVFPGGQVEVGENVIDGVKREIMEETGIEVEVGELFSISSNTCTYPGYNGVKTVPTKLFWTLSVKRSRESRDLQRRILSRNSFRRSRFLG